MLYYFYTSVVSAAYTTYKLFRYVRSATAAVEPNSAQFWKLSGYVTRVMHCPCTLCIELTDCFHFMMLCAVLCALLLVCPFPALWSLPYIRFILIAYSNGAVLYWDLQC